MTRSYEDLRRESLGAWQRRHPKGVALRRPKVKKKVRYRDFTAEDEVRERYRTDPVYRERMKALARERYARNKAKEL